jgi:diguanylate cyclase (GGDEF)-like protein
MLGNVAGRYGRGVRLKGDRGLSWSSTVPLLLVIAFNSALVALLVFEPLSGAWTAGIDNCAQFVGPIIAVPWALGRLGSWPIPFARGRRGTDARTWAPVCLGLGALCFGLGQIIWAWYELVVKQSTPFPSLADVFFLAEYPFLVAGVLLLPRRRLSGAVMSRVALDACMVMAAAVTFSWYFVLGPTLAQGGESLLAQFVGAAYPFLDLVLIVALFFIAAQARNAVSGSVVILVGLGLGAVLMADSLFDYGTLHGTYHTGDLLDVGWPLACMILCLAGRTIRREIATEAQLVAPRHEVADESPHWVTVLPYAFVPAVGALLLYVIHAGSDPQLRLGVEIGSACLVLLVLFRQVLALEENRALSRTLRSQNSELAQANERLEALATTDPHTGLPNHRAMVSALDAELERSYRYRRPCGLLFVDLDHFKSLNDTHGHLAGDGVLSEVSEVMRRSLRGVDIVGRWGGEEFVVLLPETDASSGLEAAERIREAVAAHECAAAGGAHVTCSIGLAAYPDDGGQRDQLIALADRAMYAAKKLGRNQVRTADDPVIAALPGEPALEGLRRESEVIRTVAALGALVEARDQTTGAHLLEVARRAKQVALAMGIGAEEACQVELAATLHDIGKIGIPDSILRKPGRLSPDEWDLMRAHAAAGADIVLRFPGLDALAPMIRGHHERWDGAGYPDRLPGDSAPLGARIIAVVDAFGAMTADRPYRKSAGREAAINEVRRCAGTQFDPRVVEAFERVLELEISQGTERRAG